MSSELRNDASAPPAVSWGGRAGRLFRAVQTVTGKRTTGGQIRIAHALWTGVSSFARSAAALARILFHQITGTFFAFFALVGGVAAWREYAAYHAGKVGPGRALLASAFCVMFAWFAATSFVRAAERGGSGR